MFSVDVLFRDSQQILCGSWPYSRLCYHSDFFNTTLIIVMEFLKLRLYTLCMVKR